MGKPATEEPDSSSGDEILSPMPGTFYITPSPDDHPFVKEGDSIKKGDILCIIEAMKIMNEIEAEDKGVIQKILVENGQAIEFNQPLFIIEPN
jgi:acetyl-CoA carboxylase biotin carboxyl carrier protein